MADEKDLFAPPTDEELFAAPTEAELQSEEADIPEDQDIIEQVADKLETGATTGTAVVGTKAAQEFIESRSPDIRATAEERAFKGIGGGQTKAGGDIIEKEIGALAPENVYITKKDIGREALEEGLLGGGGVRPLRPEAWQGYKQAAEKKRLGLEALINELDPQTGDISTELITDRYKQAVDETASPFAQDVRKAAKKRIGEIQQEPYTSLKDIEQRKRELQSDAYESRGKPLPKAVKEAEARAFKEAGEEAVADIGRLDEFASAKKAGGVAKNTKKIAQEILKKRETKLPFSIGSIPEGIRKTLGGAQMRYQGGMAVAEDKLADFLDRAQKSYSELPFFQKLGKGVWKAAPIVAGFMAYETAKASGANEAEALAQAVKEEIVPFPIEMLTESEGLDAQAYESLEEQEAFGESVFKEEAKTPEYKLEAGIPLNEEERQELSTGQLAAKFTTSKPEEIQQISEKLARTYPEKATPYINVLNKAMDAPSDRKSALLFSLYQQPAFRKMLMEKENGRSLEE